MKTKQQFVLSEEDAKQAVAEWIERKFGSGKPILVRLEVDSVMRGIGMSEHAESVVCVSAERDA